MVSMSLCRHPSIATEPSHEDATAAEHCPPGAEDASFGGEHDSDEDDEEGETKGLKVSFVPSNVFVLQAMEGASAKARVDLERATAAAIRRIHLAKRTPPPSPCSGEKTQSAGVVVPDQRKKLRAEPPRKQVLPWFLLFLCLVFVALGQAPLVRSAMVSSRGIVANGFPPEQQSSLSDTSDIDLMRMLIVI
ncbi:unnamed protein product [Pseudo-nitzschia multistriata]|uniref:Transmembrane protein n=1 Tax=Pseudo-nitzschia multistriata TaxID=183589 RepID=A0A448ZL33_9STRA|nr:unnamed protein product [Pseudo-nitzschia multistriata]